MVLPSGEIATANTLPRLPTPIGGRMIFCRLPSASVHSRTVLSSDPVTARRQVLSTLICRIAATCIPVSMVSTGAVSGHRLAASVSDGFITPSSGPE
jgi:hypothetical protein